MLQKVVFQGLCIFCGILCLVLVIIQSVIHYGAYALWVGTMIYSISWISSFLLYLNDTSVNTLFQNPDHKGFVTAVAMFGFLEVCTCVVALIISWCCPTVYMDDVSSVYGRHK